MSSTIASLVVKLRGDADQLSRTLNTVGGRLRTLAGGAARATKAAGAVGVVGGGLAFAGLTSMARAASANIDANAKLATALGSTVNEVQQFKLQADLSGTSVEKLAQAGLRLSRLGTVIGEGSKVAADGLARLGLAEAEVAALSPAAALNLVIARLRGVESASEQGAIANALFGRTWQDLLPLIRDGGEAARRATGLFQSLGFGLGDGAARATERLNDNFTLLGAGFTALRDQVFGSLAPALAQITDNLLTLLANSVAAAGGAGVLAEAIAVKLVGGLRSAIEFGLGLIEVFGFLADIVRPVANLIGNAIGGLAAVLVPLFQGDFAQARRAGGLEFDPTADTGNEAEQLSELQRQTRALEALLANGVGAAFR